MNLKELFEMQRKLDLHIVKEKGLEGQDLLPQKILALQVELGELANEWRGFKFWSNNHKARTIEKVNCNLCHGTGDQNIDNLEESAESNKKHEYIECTECNGTGISHYRSPLREEYVDCLHFILSIGLSLGMDWRLQDGFAGRIFSSNITKQFNKLFDDIATLAYNLNCMLTPMYYLTIVEYFLGLGQLLGFTEEIIVQAYKEKNQVNHVRQENGY